MTTLRQRNRQAAIEHIQDTAFALFEEHGYPGVTIAQIAAAAGVSESTFYRLFATKEGLFTATPWEPGTEVPAGLDLAHLPGLIRDVIKDNPYRGLTWVLTEPDVRRAVLASLDELGDLLVTHSAGPRIDAAVQVRHLLFGVYLTSLEQWHLDGRAMPVATYYDRALAVDAANRP